MFYYFIILFSLGRYNERLSKTYKVNLDHRYQNEQFKLPIVLFYVDMLKPYKALMSHIPKVSI